MCSIRWPRRRAARRSCSSAPRPWRGRRRPVNFFHKLSVALPLLLIAAWAGAIAVSRRRRRTVLQLGFTLALAMAVTLIGYHVGRGEYLKAITSVQLPRAGRRRDLRRLAVGVLDAARTVFVVGLVIWLGALLAGPAGWAVSVRGALPASSRAQARRPSAGARPGAGRLLGRPSPPCPADCGPADRRRGARLLGHARRRRSLVDRGRAAGLPGDRRVREQARRRPPTPARPRPARSSAQTALWPARRATPPVCSAGGAPPCR